MWLDLWVNHRGKLVGISLGVFFGFIYLFAGFWQMLVFAWIVLIGFYIGRKLDHHEPILPYRQFMEWISDRWRLFK